MQPQARCREVWISSQSMELVTRALWHSNPSHTQLCHAESIIVRPIGTAGTAVAVQGYDIGCEETW